VKRYGRGTDNHRYKAGHDEHNGLGVWSGNAQAQDGNDSLDPADDAQSLSDADDDDDDDADAETSHDEQGGSEGWDDGSAPEASESEASASSGHEKQGGEQESNTKGNASLEVALEPCTNHETAIPLHQQKATCRLIAVTASAATPGSPTEAVVPPGKEETPIGKKKVHCTGEDESVTKKTKLSDGAPKQQVRQTISDMHPGKKQGEATTGLSAYAKVDTGPAEPPADAVSPDSAFSEGSEEEGFPKMYHDERVAEIYLFPLTFNDFVYDKDLTLQKAVTQEQPSVTGALEQIYPYTACALTVDYYMFAEVDEPARRRPPTPPAFPVYFGNPLQPISTPENKNGSVRPFKSTHPARSEESQAEMPEEQMTEEQLTEEEIQEAKSARAARELHEKLNPGYKIDTQMYRNRFASSKNATTAKSAQSPTRGAVFAHAKARGVLDARPKQQERYATMGDLSSEVTEEVEADDYPRSPDQDGASWFSLLEYTVGDKATEDNLLAAIRLFKKAATQGTTRMAQGSKAILTSLGYVYGSKASRGSILTHSAEIKTARDLVVEAIEDYWMPSGVPPDVLASARRVLEKAMELGPARTRPGTAAVAPQGNTDAAMESEGSPNPRAARSQFGTDRIVDEEPGRKRNCNPAGPELADVQKYERPRIHRHETDDAPDLKLLRQAIDKFDQSNENQETAEGQIYEKALVQETLSRLWAWLKALVSGREPGIGPRVIQAALAAVLHVYTPNHLLDADFHVLASALHRFLTIRRGQLLQRKENRHADLIIDALRKTLLSLVANASSLLSAQRASAAISCHLDTKQMDMTLQALNHARCESELDPKSEPQEFTSALRVFESAEESGLCQALGPRRVVLVVIAMLKRVIALLAWKRKPRERPPGGRLPRLAYPAVDLMTGARILPPPLLYEFSSRHATASELERRITSKRILEGLHQDEKLSRVPPQWWLHGKGPAPAQRNKKVDESTRKKDGGSVGRGGVDRPASQPSKTVHSPVASGNGLDQSTAQQLAVNGAVVPGEDSLESSVDIKWPDTEVGGSSQPSKELPRTKKPISGLPVEQQHQSEQSTRPDSTTTLVSEPGLGSSVATPSSPSLTASTASASPSPSTAASPRSPSQCLWAGTPQRAPLEPPPPGFRSLGDFLYKAFEAAIKTVQERRRQEEQARCERVLIPMPGLPDGLKRRSPSARKPRAPPPPPVFPDPRGKMVGYYKHWLSPGRSPLRIVTLADELPNPEMRSRGWGGGSETSSTDDDDDDSDDDSDDSDDSDDARRIRALGEARGSDCGDVDMPDADIKSWNGSGDLVSPARDEGRDDDNDDNEPRGLGLDRNDDESGDIDSDGNDDYDSGDNYSDENDDEELCYLGSDDIDDDDELCYLGSDEEEERRQRQQSPPLKPTFKHFRVQNNNTFWWLNGCHFRMEAEGPGRTEMEQRVLAWGEERKKEEEEGEGKGDGQRSGEKRKSDEEFETDVKRVRR